MTKLFPAVALLAVALLTTACRPAGPQPSQELPPSRPAAETGAPAPAQAAGPPGAQMQPVAIHPDAPGPQPDAPRSTGLRVLGAIGKAVRNSVIGESQK